MLLSAPVSGSIYYSFGKILARLFLLVNMGDMPGIPGSSSNIHPTHQDPTQTLPPSPSSPFIEIYYKYCILYSYALAIIGCVADPDPVGPNPRLLKFTYS
jgi:hypothetical protein